MSYRPKYRTSREPATRVPLWRLIVVIIGLFWILAAVMYVVSQWVVPTFYSSVPNTSTGFNFGQSFGTPFIKTWGLRVAGGLFVLGPFAALWRALERGGEAVMGKALGTSVRRRRAR